MRWQVRSLELTNGVTLQYVEQGDAQGVPVLLLHGITDSWRSFEPVLPHLPAWMRAVALTQRGHGDSDRPHSGYGPSDFAGDVVLALDALGMADAVVVGHSMGSVNAMQLAVEHPACTRGLVLVGTFASCGGHPALVEFCNTAIAPLADPIAPEFVREFQESTLGQPVPEALLAAVVAESLKVPARVWREAFSGLLEDTWTAHLSQITAPTLVVWGARDAFCPRADQEALLTTLPDARLEVYEHAGHAVHWEEPERFARDLVTFVQDVVLARD